MFFIVSTGRSGTMTLADLLNQSADCLCLHEPQPTLMAEAVQYRYGEIDAAQLRELIRATRPIRTEDGRQYGELNHKLSLVIPLLHEVFPDARFVWLIRDGRDVVASLMKRKWYTHVEGNLWHLWHPRGDKIGDVDARRWSGMTAFAKCCWYWSYINQLIETSLLENELPASPLFLENIENEAPKLFDFLGLPKPESIQINRLNPSNPSRADDPSSWRTWNQQEQETFTDICGPAMDKFYAHPQP